jgi:hypothetical protein
LSYLQSCVAEIANVELWVDVNNLTLNRTQYAQIVYVPPPAVAGFKRVESIKALGVTISRVFPSLNTSKIYWWLVRRNC